MTRQVHIENIRFPAIQTQSKTKKEQAHPDAPPALRPPYASRRGAGQNLEVGANAHERMITRFAKMGRCPKPRRSKPRGGFAQKVRNLHKNSVRFWDRRLGYEWTLRMHAYCSARLDASNQLFQFGHQRCKVFKRFAGGTQNCDGDVELPERLLFGKIVVHRDQNVEVFLSCTEQSAVPQSFPAAIFYRFRPRLSGSRT